MGKSLSQTLGVSDPLDNAIHDFINPGQQPNNFKAPPWWGPVTPQGSGGGWSQHSAIPMTAPVAPPGAAPTVRPAGAPPLMPPPVGSIAPPLVDGRVARGIQPAGAGMAPAPVTPAALAAGLANVGSRSAVADPNFGKNPAPAGVINKVNGVVVPVGQQLPPGVR